MADEKINIIVSLKDMMSNQIDKIQLGLNKFGKQANDAAKEATALQKQMEGIGKIGKTVAVGAGAVAGVLGLVGRAAIKASGDWETMRTSFETMLGSTEKADVMLEQFKNTASSTPLTLAGMADAGKTLLQFGLAAKDIVPTIKMLGDVSGGNQEKLNSLSLAFGQMSSTGRLMGQDLLQMINVGFNPLKEISDHTGKSMTELKKQMEAGAISSDMVTESFKRATSEGGQFYGMMDKQSQTLAGRWSTLQDAFDGVLRTIGDALMPIAKAFVEILIKIAEGFNNLSPTIKTTIAVIGGIVFAITALATIFGTLLAILPAIASGLAIFTGTTITATAAAVGATGATVGFGAALSAAIWPITLIVAGIAALIAGYIALKNITAPLTEKTKELSKEHDNLQKKSKSLTDQMKALADQHKENGSEYLKLQNELKKTNSDMAENEKKIRANIAALADEKKAIEAKIKAQQGEVSKAKGDKKINELAELEALESKKKEIIAASNTAQLELDSVFQESKNENKKQKTIEQTEWEKQYTDEMKAANTEKQIADQEAEMAYKEQLFQAEMARVGANEEAKNSLLKQYQTIRQADEQKLNDMKYGKYMEGSKKYVDFIAANAEKEKDIGKAVAQGTLEFIKDGLKQQILAKSAAMVAEGTAIIVASMGGAPQGWTTLAAGVGLAGAGVAAINSIQLAEGGIVQPQSGGVSATIAEAGSAEAVIPLDDPEAKAMLGGGGNNISINISGKPLAKEMYEIQQEMIRTGELSA